VDNGDKIGAIGIDFSKVLNLIPHDRLLMKIAISRVDSRAVPWVREFLLGRTQTIKLRGQISEDVRVTYCIRQGSIFGLLLFLAYVNDIWRNNESTIGVFADDCVLYIKMINNEDI
jgi:hypothetical protein